MKQYYNHRVLIWICLCSSLLWSCHQENKIETKPNHTHEDINPKYVEPLHGGNTKDTLNIEVLKKNSYQKAVQQYGRPYEHINFILDGALPESRIELYNHYTDQEYRKKNIEIKEATWIYNGQQDVRIWYEYQQEQWKMVHYMIFDKGTVF